ncbi:MAG TPA: HK97 family phage prohead protease [Tepidisphaeraceae bacterium]|nr:HK97 family phage prohead protease [Tepidisphaeraceae bacterium]
MNQQFETRYFKSVGSELRVLPTSNGQPAKFTGRAAAFNSPSDDLGGFKEIIAPGAFRDSLSKNGDIRALVGHDPDRLMGRTSSGTLRLTETLDGLHFENDIPDTSYARDLVELARRGDIKGMSFGFRVPKGGDAWAKGSDGRAVRTLKSVDLGEISYVANPAYGSTGFSQRDVYHVDDETREAARRCVAGSRPAYERCQRMLALMELQSRAA